MVSINHPQLPVVILTYDIKYLQMSNFHSTNQILFLLHSHQGILPFCTDMGTESLQMLDLQSNQLEALCPVFIMTDFSCLNMEPPAAGHL